MNAQLLAGIARLSDAELLAQLTHLARHEREATASLVAHLAETDERNLHLARGFSSLIEYCIVVLHYSEGGASKRVRAARTARQYPRVLEMLATGELSLATVGLLAAELTRENHAELLAAARFKTKREVEEVVADWRPQPAVPFTIRKLPSAAPAAKSNGAPAAPELVIGVTPAPSEFDPGELSATRPTKRPSDPLVIEPLGAGRYRVQFTASAETRAKLLRAQALLRHAVPKGDGGAIMDRALTALLAQLEKTKLASTGRAQAGKPGNDNPGTGKPARAGSRHIPAAVKRQVWERDEQRCTFTGPEGRRCTATAFLEIDHVQPFAAGGEARVENLRLLCRAHNRHAADVFFGPENVKRHIEAKKQRARPRDDGDEGFTLRETSVAWRAGPSGWRAS